jgi:hypothetical protein
MNKSILKKQIKQMNSKVTEWISQMRDTYEIEIRVNELNDNYKLDYRNLFDTISELKRNNSETKTIAKHLQNAESEIELLKAQSCNCHTNTQKENKNATTPKESGKKEYSETIVTNAMFNEQTSQILLDIRNSQLQLIAYQALDTILATGLHYTHVQALITSILIKKGNEYSQETDRYSNFIEDDITIPQAIKNYQQKHIRWLLDYQDGKIQANILLILEHCIDIINYSILLKVWEKYNANI